MMNSGKKGFSLLELLVVIGIIGILVSIGTVAYRSAQERARDSRRRQDVDAVGKALEQYYADNLSYPASGDCSGYETYFAGNIPSDPVTGTSYVQGGDCAVDGSAFCVCAELEAEGAGNAYEKAAGSTCSWSGAGSQDYYCVQSLQ